MRDKFAPVIEGLDCDKITNPWSLRCETFFEDGGNGGTMLDGTTVHDVLAAKKRFSWTLNVLTMERYNAFVTALASGAGLDTVSATVLDPATDTKYSTMFHVTPPTFRFIIDINDAIIAIPDSPLVLEETGDEKGDEKKPWKLEDGTLIVDIPPGKTPEEIWPEILQEITPYISDIIKIITTDDTPIPPEILDELTGMLPNLEEINGEEIAERLRIYVENDTLIISGVGASVSEGCLSLTSDDVSVISGAFHYNRAAKSEKGESQ